MWRTIQVCIMPNITTMYDQVIANQNCSGVGRPEHQDHDAHGFIYERHYSNINTLIRHKIFTTKICQLGNPMT